eukprot:5058954-Pyramimonas_sp.AAC.1
MQEERITISLGRIARDRCLNPREEMERAQCIEVTKDQLEKVKETLKMARAPRACLSDTSRRAWG